LGGNLLKVTYKSELLSSFIISIETFSPLWCNLSSWIVTTQHSSPYRNLQQQPPSD